MAIDGINANTIKSTENVIKKGKKLSNEELINSIIKNGREKLHSMMDRMVPENGKFSEVAISFDIPQTNNEAIISIVHDAIEPKNLRCINIGVHHQNSDRMASVYLKTGTKNELKEYLNNEDCESKILSYVRELSQKTDDYYSSL